MENIKITSGKYRGRTIKSPNSKLTHPMGAREKLAMFNMISEYLCELCNVCRKKSAHGWDNS